MLPGIGWVCFLLEVYKIMRGVDSIDRRNFRLEANVYNLRALVNGNGKDV